MLIWWQFNRFFNICAFSFLLLLGENIYACWFFFFVSEFLEDFTRINGKILLLFYILHIGKILLFYIRHISEFLLLIVIIYFSYFTFLWHISMLKIVQLNHVLENKASFFLLAEVSIWWLELHLLLLQILWVGWWMFKPKCCQWRVYYACIAHMPFMWGKMYTLIYILLIVKYLFITRGCVTSQLEMNMAFLPFVVHNSCIEANGGKTDDSGDALFCGNKCQEVWYIFFHSFICSSFNHYVIGWC